MPTINIAGPEGNAFYLLGAAEKYGKQMGFDTEKRKQIQEEMKSGDYNNLLKVFIKNFGMVVKIKGGRR